jgi:hypothetical protein
VANVASFVQEGADTRVMLPEGQSVLLRMWLRRMQPEAC